MAALTHGPWVMWTRDTSARIWFRLDGAGTVSARAGAVFSSPVPVDASTNYCGCVVLEPLAAGTEYLYQLTVDGVAAGGPYSFRTMPPEGQPGSFTAFFSTCAHFDINETLTGWQAYVPFGRYMDGLKGTSKFLIMAGDFEIAPPATTEDLTGRRADLLTIRGRHPEMLDVHAKLPTYAVWDDWDFLSNNSAGGNHPVGKFVAAQVWREMWAGSPAWPDPVAIYQSFRVADCLFLLVDGRFFRDATPGTLNPAIANRTRAGHDYLNARWLGDAQLAWIKQTLLDNADAPFKFFVMGDSLADHSAVGPFGAAARESVGLYYRRDRNDLLAWLAQNPACAEGLIVLNGDDHRGLLRVIDDWRDPEPIGCVPQADQLPAATWPSHPYVTVPELKMCPFGVFPALDNLTDNWRGSPFAVFEDLTRQGFVGRLEVDTGGREPRAIFSWVSLGSANTGTYADVVRSWGFSRVGKTMTFEPLPRADSPYTGAAGSGSGWTPVVLP